MHKWYDERLGDHRGQSGQVEGIDAKVQQSRRCSHSGIVQRRRRCSDTNTAHSTQGMVRGRIESRNQPDSQCERPRAQEIKESMMTDYSSIAKTLMDSLKLRVEPVAVCMTDRPPEGVRGPSEPAAAGCVFWERGAQGAFVTSPSDHSNCVVGMYTHHMPLATSSQQENLNDC